MPMKGRGRRKRRRGKLKGSLQHLEFSLHVWEPRDTCKKPTLHRCRESSRQETGLTTNCIKLCLCPLQMLLSSHKEKQQHRSSCRSCGAVCTLQSGCWCEEARGKSLRSIPGRSESLRVRMAECLRLLREGSASYLGCQFARLGLDPRTNKYSKMTCFVRGKEEMHGLSKKLCNVHASTGFHLIPECARQTYLTAWKQYQSH